MSRLGLDDSAILVEEASACSLAASNLKVLWVVNSENYIYKRNSLNRAKEVNILSYYILIVVDCQKHR